MKKKLSNNKGFSLVELIIVIAIMAVLIGVLAPQYLKYVEKSKISSDADLVASIRSGLETMISDPDYTITDGSVTISGTGITVSSFDAQDSSGSVVATVMGSNWTNQKFKSKKYKALSGGVTFTIASDTDGIPKLTDNAPLN